MGPIILNLGPHGINQGSLRAYKLKFGAPCYQSKLIEWFGPLIAVGAHNLKFGASKINRNSLGAHTIV